MALEHASTGDSSMHNISHQSDQQLSMEESAQHHRQLAEEWERLMGRVRDIPGFKSFLQSKRFTELHIATKAGPVVVVNVHESRCNAFILVDGLDGVGHIPLPAFSYMKFPELHLHLSELLSTAGVCIRDTDIIRAMKRVTAFTHGGFEFILSTLWSCIVKPVLDSLAFTISCLLIN